MDRLQHLKLHTLIDAAYLASRVGTPIFLYVAAPSGAGKTWAAEGLAKANLPGVTYYSKSYSSYAYREYVREIAPRTTLFIHDDVGQTTERTLVPFISIWCQMADGLIDWRYYQNSWTIPCNFSVILISTEKEYTAWLDEFNARGLYTRYLPVLLGFSEDAAIEYRASRDKAAKGNDALIEAGMSPDSKKAPPRRLMGRAFHEALDLGSLQVAPRHYDLLKNISRYLTAEELRELVQIVQEPCVRYQI